MSKWWFKVPIILGSILMVVTTVVFGKVVYAASGMPEFGIAIAGMIEGFGILIKGFVDIIEMVLAY